MAKRGWLIVVTTGFVFVLCALIVVGLVMMDKAHFGSLVGSAFLPVIASGVIAGGILMLIGSLLLRGQKTWHRVVLILFALIAVTSPLMGFLFLLPWGLLAVSSPLVIWILVAMRRQP